MHRIAEGDSASQRKLTTTVLVISSVGTLAYINLAPLINLQKNIPLREHLFNVCSICAKGYLKYILLRYSHFLLITLNRYIQSNIVYDSGFCIKNILHECYNFDCIY